MNLCEVIALSCGVSLDLFAVAVTLGLMIPQITGAVICRVLPILTIPSLLTLIAGQQVAEHCLNGSVVAERYFTPLALGGIGSLMIAGPKNTVPDTMTKTTWLSLIALGCVASCDVGIAGMAMATREGTTAVLMAFVPALTVTAVLAGLLFGSRLSNRAGRFAELIGGSLLVIIAEYRCFS